MSNEVRTKVKNKAKINGKVDLSGMSEFGNRLQIPKYIKDEMEEAGLEARFISVKKVQEGGGYHPMGWTPYKIKNPQPNPLTGQADSVYRVGDLVLACKTKEAQMKHRAYLDSKSQAQTQAQKNAAREMRDKIREGRADKHIALIEGYDENGDDE